MRLRQNRHAALGCTVVARGTVRRAVRSAVLVAVLAGAAAAGCRPDNAPPLADPEPVPLYTPAWAFEPWISKDISNGADTRSFLAGFRERDIPVGVVVLDSPWETNYNTFIPNEDRYPGFAEMVQDFLDDRATPGGVRTVLWTTQMVNEASFDLEPGGDSYDGAASNFAEGQERGHFVNDGDVSLWWKGNGAAVDFFSAEARAWWHAQQEDLLAMGIAGFKLDFGEQYIPDGPIRTSAGEKTRQEYSEAYYRDFLENGARTRAGGVKEFVTMVRPYDESYGFEPRFYARPEHAPVAWVGDQLRSFVGLVDALDHIFRSAQAGYTMLGSDIGGYLDTNVGDEVPFSLANFRRWTAVSALMPFFQLHGRANLAPWSVPVTDPALVDETVTQYRVWATLHHALAPFFFSVVREAQLRGGSSLHVVGDGPGDWADDWRFFAGDAFLVAPLISEADRRSVLLPATDDGAGYIDWYELGGEVVPARSTVLFTASHQKELGLWVKEGAIIPMRIDSDARLTPAGLGEPSFADALSILAFPGPTPTSFVLHDADDNTSELRLAAGVLHIKGVAGRVIVRLRADSNSAAFVNDTRAAQLTNLSALATVETPAYVPDEAGRALWIAVPNGGDVRLEARAP